MFQGTDDELPIIASFSFALDLRHHHVRDCHDTPLLGVLTVRSVYKDSLRLARVVLNDQLLVQVAVDLRTLGQAQYISRE